MGEYDDIINLRHHTSVRHPHMAMYDRAAEFASFDALKGYGEALQETEGLHNEIYDEQTMQEPEL